MKFRITTLIAALVAALVYSIPTFAQEEALEEVVVLGSRAKPRSVSESAVPVDVISGDDFQKQGGSDLQDLLRNVVPSYNVNLQPISDAATVVRPMNLRGLAPDQTLILVNGKRRHRASVIYWLGNGVSEGAQGQDISAIPALALKSVEVLRDGAAAQYGSDAIAGVINFQLKEGGSEEGGAISLKAGTHAEGDGQATTIAINQGLGNEDAWINLTLEYGGQDETDRSVQRDDAQGLIDVGVPVAVPAQKWGQPIVENDLKLFANYKIALSDTLDFYGQANYASKRVEGGFYFRNPHTRSGVFSTDSGKTLLVGDTQSADPNDTNCPNPTITNGIIQDKYYETSDRCYSHIERFPGGFTPRFGADTADFSFLAGIRGEVNEDLSWDLSFSRGAHESDFFIFNTVNSSMGAATPTEFDPGTYAQADTALNFDVGYQATDKLFVGFGFERRTEEFTIIAGQPESYSVGSPGDFVAGRGDSNTHYLAQQGFTPASNGFSGFTPESSGSWIRSNIAYYLDAEYAASDNLFVSLALRQEDFDDFGSASNHRLAVRIKHDEVLSLRASVGTGFRAPTPGQQNAFNITTQFNADTGDLQNDATIPATHPLAQLSGGKQLEPEESINASAGVVINHDAFDLTIDFFSIRLVNRLTPSSEFDKAAADTATLKAISENNTEVETLATYRFFVNDFETITSGLDVVFTKTIFDANFNLAYNYTENKVTKRNPNLVDDGRVNLLEGGLPKTRWNLSVDKDIGEKLNIVARASYYGGWYDGEDDQSYGGATLFDLEAAYNITEKAILSVGGNNILNTFPDENPGAAGGVGNKYSQFSPFGFNGAFYYVKLNYTY